MFGLVAGRARQCAAQERAVLGRRGRQTDMTRWASLSQIKELALIDNVLRPFVKTILLPL
jgi:hypothetical protein